MRIEQLMTRNVVTVPPAASLKEVARLLTEELISGVPVCDPNGAVLGVISGSDIVRVEQGIAPSSETWLHRIVRRRADRPGESRGRTAGAAMTAPAVTVRPTAQVAVAARLMVEHRVNRLPVVSNGRLVGIVTRTDLVRAFHRSDEDIASEIREDVLRRALWIDPETLHVNVEDGVVTVRGRMETEFDGEAVTEAIRCVPGVTEVRPELTCTLRDSTYADQRSPGF